MEYNKDYQVTAGNDDPPVGADTEQKSDRDMTEWEQMDARISGHPFLQKYTLAERKALQDQAKGADADPQYKEERTAFMEFVTELLKVAPLIIKETYKNTSGAANEVEEGRSFFHRVVDLEEDHLPKREKLMYYFDGCAYVEAINNCISRYNEAYINPKTKRPSSFLGLFTFEYRNCLNDLRNKTKYKRTISFSEDSWKKVKKIIRFFEQNYPDYKSYDLPTSVYQTIAKAYHWPMELTVRVVKLIRECNTVPIDAETDDSGKSLIDILPDLNSTVEKTDLTTETLIYSVIDAISGLELKDYLKLLMNNLLLYPIHQEIYPPADKNISLKNEDLDYKDSLRQNQERLKQNVWDFGYLSFVAWKDAEGKDGNAEDIEVLCNYYPLQPLLNQTIAQYKECTPANITYYSKKFAKIRKQVADMVRDNW